MKIKSLNFIGCCYLLILLTSSPATWGNSVGKVNVMDVDEVRDAAQIARVKAQEKSDSEDGFGDGAGAQGGGCGSLEIGNVQSGGIGRPVPREVIIVIEGPVINSDNRCR